MTSAEPGPRGITADAVRPGRRRRRSPGKVKERCALWTSDAKPAARALYEGYDDGDSRPSDAKPAARALYEGYDDCDSMPAARALYEGYDESRPCDAMPAARAFLEGYDDGDSRPCDEVCNVIFAIFRTMMKGAA